MVSAAKIFFLRTISSTAGRVANEKNMVMLFNEVQLVKALNPIVFKWLDMVMLSNDLHVLKANGPMSMTDEISKSTNPLDEKALTPMLLTNGGILTICNFSQRPKAESPMLLTNGGILTVCKFLKLSKAYDPIFSTVSGMWTLVTLNLHSSSDSQPRLFK
tara:strand:+ start:149 stop:628 length:480 start_codon:yes stop_codon:yes gene_type:complete